MALVEDEEVPFKRFILYLEPTENVNPLYNRVKQFYVKSMEEIEMNEAQQYPPHCSITGFFLLNSERQGYLEKILQVLFETIEDGIKKFPLSVNLGHVELGTHDWVGTGQVKRIMMPSVKIKLVTSGFSELAESIKVKLSPFQVEVRPKSVDHISLAYVANYPLVSLTNDGGKYSFMKRVCCSKTQVVEFDPEEYFCMANEFFKGFLVDSNDWSLALYEEEHSFQLDVPHVFLPIRKWSLKDQLAINSYPDR